MLERQSSAVWDGVRRHQTLQSGYSPQRIQALRVVVSRQPRTLVRHLLCFSRTLLRSPGDTQGHDWERESARGR
jgi:hypothetical protein